ncbi:MAG TPA: glycoside hydrolase family 99-like domain-containing protein [Casimicrobiaceae bacterium]|nr:glycoside hydrolase family 99-like domain-containing protein [Casimicrobiaceae bacterium]
MESAARTADQLNQNNLVKLIAFYFPQFHAIPENDVWWSKGFTDWVNVRRAKPQFRGHYQPRVPLDERYYDQSDKATIEWQIDLARRYGLSGFCHYHYWFDGKQLLETPTNIVMASKELNFPFCLAWANETWSRRWDGLDHHILQLQTHRPDPALWERHFEYLFRAWSDERAIKVDGKPIFLVYRPHRIQQIDRMFDLWRTLAHRRGLPGIYLAAIKQFEFPVPAVLRHFDATVQFQPFEALFSPDFEGDVPVSKGDVPVSKSDVPVSKGDVPDRSWLVVPLRKLPPRVQHVLRAIRYRLLVTPLRAIRYRLLVPPLRAIRHRLLMTPLRRLPDRLQDVLRAIRYRFLPRLTFYDYEKVWSHILRVEREGGIPAFPGAFVDWDNTARYKNRARIFKGASPERFAYWFKRLVEITAQRPAPEHLIFMDAWNEWAEGAYLEPDARYGYRYLEAVRDGLACAANVPVSASLPAASEREAISSG